MFYYSINKYNDKTNNINIYVYLIMVEEEETNWKVKMSFAQVNRSAFFSFFSSSVHMARHQSEALLFLTPETYSIWLLCSQFHLLFAQISALHSGLSVQFSYCSAQPAIHLVFHMLQNLSVT